MNRKFLFYATKPQVKADLLCIDITMFDDSIIFLTQMYLNKIFATKTVSVINQQQLPNKIPIQLSKA